ncbi:MAG: DNA repair protein RecO [Gammaproteobacteria bacterium]|nr:MAG: DNA repair protein RecO [Gammaproteobacteria bacterium]
MLVEKDNAYFLHATPYRENSLLVYLLTQKHGKVSFIVTGVKSANRGKTPYHNKTALLQPCRPIIINYRLKNGLSKLSEIEPQAANQLPDIKYFMLYQYVNELLLKLLPEQFADAGIFTAYKKFLAILCQDYPYFALRLMELSLIDYFDGLTGLYQQETLRHHVDKTKNYYLHRATGIAENPSNHSTATISGQQLSAFNYLVALYQQHLTDKQQEHLADNVTADARETLAKAAQPISSFFIAGLLGDKPLNTRYIYRQLRHRKLL